MERDLLEALVERGLTLRAIGAELGAHPRTVAGWLRELGLETQGQRRRGRSDSRRARFTCAQHGVTEFTRKREGGWRCLKCRSDAVSRRRRRMKEILVAEAGGACVECGYSRSLAALHFHHLDPAAKRFSVAGRGLTRSLDEARKEARKCVLLCSNCHAEVEAGMRLLQANDSTADQEAEHIPG
jgi:5-methylcytosine-specific restriction endonuclease McrA